MARIRTIKPQFFTSEDMAALPLRTRLTFAGLWTIADDFGNGNANPKLIKAAIWSLDDDVAAADVQTDMDALAANGQLDLYNVDGRSYFAVVAWKDHQRVDRPTRSKIPAPASRPTNEASTHPREDDARPREKASQEGEGNKEVEEGGDAVASPPRRCSAHLSDDNPPNCGRCREARLAREAWDKANPTRPALSLLPPRKEDLCPTHEWRMKTDCPECGDRQAVAS